MNGRTIKPSESHQDSIPGLPESIDHLVVERPEISRCDIIGDVHGCYDELVDLLKELGRGDLLASDLPPTANPPELLFVGDIVDRGDRILDSLRLVLRLVESGHAATVMGNHDYKFFRWLQGRDVKLSHGMERTVEEFRGLPAAEQADLKQRLIRHYAEMPYAILFDGGKGVVVHAAWRTRMLNETDAKNLRYYALFGPTTGERTPEGYPQRIDWASSYRGPQLAVFGHQVYAEPYRKPFAIGIDTGCVFGGALTALRYPSLETVAVPSREARYYGGPASETVKKASGFSD